jgi:hypothetical protein
VLFAEMDGVLAAFIDHRASSANILRGAQALRVGLRCVVIEVEYGDVHAAATCAQSPFFGADIRDGV